ncbi:hypothetical protein IFR04_000532 [Cadophora malorum]|uniref:Uncharacterized protein n=1 Tax=Cadophora malorum TaxID=108018 RepID=A0A8H7WKD4_9HELO|nr:hypothetical protein IFR04_000532 [Cadophora malorum]
MKTTNISKPDYSEAGFMNLSMKIKFVQFCRDLQVMNDFTIDCATAETAWVEIIKDLHKVWVQGAGADQDEIKQDLFLRRAIYQMEGDAVNQYWKKQAEKFGDTRLNRGLDVDLSDIITRDDAEEEHDIGDMSDSDFSFCSDVEQNKKGTWKEKPVKPRTPSEIHRDEELAVLQMKLCKSSRSKVQGVADISAGVGTLGLGGNVVVLAAEGEVMENAPMDISDDEAIDVDG